MSWLHTSAAISPMQSDFIMSLNDKSSLLAIQGMLKGQGSQPHIHHIWEVDKNMVLSVIEH